jgi:hypothetical protein
MSSMKNMVHVVVAAAVLAAPLVSFAQSNAPLSRAQVRQELVQLENAGYAPGAEEATYPAKLEAAEARNAQGRVAQVQETSYGGSTASGVQSGVAAQSVSKRANPQDTFFGQ